MNALALPATDVKGRRRGGSNQMINELTPTQRELAELMSDISEHA